MVFWTATNSGLALTIAGASETFMAVLYPRATNGPITAIINRVFQIMLKADWLGRSRFMMAAGPASQQPDQSRRTSILPAPYTTQVSPPQRWV